jgi:hypothetical protein
MRMTENLYYNLQQRPNFFLVGGPKCGTTALSSFLRDHPHIFFSEPKEPEFFGHDLPKHDGQRWRTDVDAYLALFAGANESHRAVGEGSVMYMYSHTAIPAIRAFAPEARLLTILRNPIELAYSFHNHLCFLFIEDQLDFEMAWDLQEERKAGTHLPKGSLKPQYLQYAEVAKQGYQLTRLLEAFPRDQVFIGLYDDFQADPRGFYLHVLDFLGVPDDNRQTFPRENFKLHHRFRAFSRWRRSLPKSVQNALRNTLTRMSAVPFCHRIGSFNRVRRERMPLSNDFRRCLSNYFKPDVAITSDIIRRDLSHWLDH